jgi:outer membrane receptor protein involved in Fe transport
LSPQRIYDEDALEQSGAGTLGEFFAKMPESFNSITPESELYGNFFGPSQLGNNVFFGYGANLFGRAPEATLTLIDGDRLVAGGASGTFLDVSMFPKNAVAEIASVAGDTSAVYGSDAIAGVVDILLKSGAEGSESRVRYGTTTDGGGGQWILSQLLGWKWRGGSGMIAFQHSQQSPVLSSSRSFIPAVTLAVDIIPEEKYSGLVCKLEHQFDDKTTVRAHLIIGSRDVIAESSGFAGYVLTRESSVREIGGTLHVDHKFSSGWTVGLYGSYSKLEQSLAIMVPAGPLPPQPGDSSLGEFSATANADLFKLQGQPVKIALGAGGRKETLTVPTSIYQTSYGSLGRRVGYVYGETLIPLAEGSHAFLEYLELSLAGREDYYEVVGPTFNPKAGLLWSPVRDLSLRATYARSFRPPTLDELAAIPAYYTALIPDHTSPTGFTDTLVDRSQGIARLRPETARTLTGGLDYRRDRSGGWSGSLTWYRTVFDNRVAEPFDGSPGSTTPIFMQSELAPYIQRSIDPAYVQAIFSNPGFLGDYGGSGYKAVTARFDDEPTNVARTFEEGLEGSLYYRIGEKPRQFTAFAIANYLLRDTHRSAPGAPIVSLLNNVGQPVNLRARSGFTLSRYDWRAALNVNYTNGYRDVLVSPIQNVRSWTTVDLQMAYEIPFSSDSNHNVQLIFNAENLLNATPPWAPVPAGSSFKPVGFDAANASPYGRRLSMEISVAW